MMHARSGKLRALAVTSPQPSRLTPGLPTETAFLGLDGLLYQRFERSIARLKADGGVDWLLLGEIATLAAPHA